MKEFPVQVKSGSGLKTMSEKCCKGEQKRLMKGKQGVQIVQPINQGDVKEFH